MTVQTFTKLFIILITLGTISSAFSQNGWKRDGLKGKVKSIQETYFEAENISDSWEKGAIQPYGHKQITFDKKGIYQGTQFLNNVLEFSDKLVPFMENQLMKEESFLDKEGQLINVTKYTYNSKNELAFNTFNDEGQKISTGKVLLKKNRIVKSLFKTFEGSQKDLLFTTVFVYNKQGDVASMTVSSEKGEIIQNTKFEYLSVDDHQNWTKRLIINVLDIDNKEPKIIAIRVLEYF